MKDDNLIHFGNSEKKFSVYRKMHGGGRRLFFVVVVGLRSTIWRINQAAFEKLDSALGLEAKLEAANQLEAHLIATGARVHAKREHAPNPEHGLAREAVQ